MIDTHCHLDLEPLWSRLATIMADARAAGVMQFVVPGVHPDNWNRIAAVTARYEGVMPAYGVHPMHSDCISDHVLECLADRISSCVAVGEIGLDPAYQVPLELQETAFRRQVRLAVQHRKPVLIHCRHAFQRTLQILKEEQADRVGGIMHAYSGSLEMAREFIKLNFVISIAATITRDNVRRPVLVVRELPLESLVVETDAPDLPPQKYRGLPNQPAWLVETVQKIAEIKGVERELVAEVCTETSRRIVRLR